MSFMTSKFNFKDSLVYVIGGSGLIGQSIVKNFLELNAKVIVLDLKNKKSNSRLIYESFNVSNFFLIEKNLKKIIKRNGVPNIIVNSSYPRTNDWQNNSYTKVKIKSFDKNVQIHMNSFVWISRFFANLMVKKKIKNCSIVNLASIYGFLGQDSFLYKNIRMSESITYPVIKGGIINSTRSMAAYYGKYKIRINTVSPGGVFDNQNKIFVKRYLQKTPLKRMAKPDDISNAVIFLASDLSSYITGTNLIVDGGFSII